MLSAAIRGPTPGAKGSRTQKASPFTGLGPREGKDCKSHPAESVQLAIPSPNDDYNESRRDLANATGTSRVNT